MTPSIFGKVFISITIFISTIKSFHSSNPFAFHWIILLTGLFRCSLVQVILLALKLERKIFQSWFIVMTLTCLFHVRKVVKISEQHF